MIDLNMTSSKPSDFSQSFLLAMLSETFKIIMVIYMQSVFLEVGTQF